MNLTETDLVSLQNKYDEYKAKGTKGTGVMYWKDYPLLMDYANYVIQYLKNRFNK